MTDTERALHAALDAHPLDHDARGVLADYLEEVGSPLAEGYRALWVLKLVAHKSTQPEWADGAWAAAPPSWSWAATETGRCRGGVLKAPWWNRLAKVSRPSPFGHGPRTYTTVRYPSRRAAEDDAARAFGELPENWKRSILKEVPG